MHQSQTLAIASSETATSHPAEGKHLLLTLRGCPRHILDDKQFIEDVLRIAVSATGATILQVATHKFEPQGTTSMAVLAESHASLHTYPEVGVAFWDCFTCGDTCDPEMSIAILVEKLQAQSIESQLLRR